MPDNFERWKWKVGDEIARVFGWALIDGRKYVEATDDGENWREMFDDGLSPEDAAGEEALAAME